MPREERKDLRVCSPLPPISGYGYQQQLPRPPCHPCPNATRGGYGFNEYGGPAASNKYSTRGGYMMNRHKIIPQGQIMRVCSKANPDYALAIRDGSAIMLFYNPKDPTMQWVKDESWGNQVVHPDFALVNKATGQEVFLTQYGGPTCYDENILWSESEDMGYGYRTIRMANNLGLNLCLNF